MNARLPCIVSRDSDRHADEEGMRAAIESLIDSTTDDVGNKIEALFGSVKWTPAFRAACREIAVAQMGKMQ